MKSPKSIFAVVVAMTCSILACFNSSSTSSKLDSEQVEREWDLSYFDGIPTRIALNRVSTDIIVHNRKILILLGEEYYNQHDLQRVFSAIAAEYSEPESLVITALSDKDSVRSQLRKKETTTLYRAPNRDLVDGPDGNSKENTDCFRAYYLRLHDEERFGYTQDPQKGDYTTVYLRRNAGP